MIKKDCTKRIFSAMIILILLGLLLAAAVQNFSGAKNYVMKAPSKQLEVNFWLDESGVPYYKVITDGVEVIESSKMGIVTTCDDLNAGFSIQSIKETSVDQMWSPLVGEQAQIHDRYQQSVYMLEHEESGKILGIEFRVYDEGAAFRYHLPEVSVESDAYRIQEEKTQFAIPAGTIANVHSYSNQTVPVPYTIEDMPEHIFTRPVTLKYADGHMLTICEANVDNYSTLKLQKDVTTERCFGVHHGKVVITMEGPGVSPWRTLVIGDKETELLENASIVQNLNEKPEEEVYHYSEWVEPGTAVMLSGTMTTDSVKQDIDRAAVHGIRYVLLDSGWYGPEQDINCDPRLDPSKISKDHVLIEYLTKEGGYQNTGEGVFCSGENGFPMYGTLGEQGDCKTEIDIPAVCEYANERGVGIILYVNGIFLPDKNENGERFTVDELFSYFEKWGVAGVKPGFIDYDSQSAEKYMEEQLIKSAAAHRLVLTIHDEYVTSGIERTYPHVLAAEGILGDEGIGVEGVQAAEDIASIFTRNVQGPADHTFCYPGKATKAYALASPLVFRSGISMLYWYTHPEDIPKQDEGKLGIWDSLPQTWVETQYLEGKLYEYVTIARKSEMEEWYIGSLSAVDRILEIPLDFLDENIVYTAEIYADGADADPGLGRALGGYSVKASQELEYTKYLVTSETTLARELKYGHGYAVKLTKATENEKNILDEYE